MKTLVVPGTIAFGLVAIILPGFALSDTTYHDYAAAEHALQEQQERVYELAEVKGRYHKELVAPLQSLAMSQLEVNRYNDAAKTADYAIEIVRTSFGLDTPQQYDLQQMAVEIDLLRQDWKAVNTRLDYYSTLILSHYWGNVPDRLARLLWLGDIHVRGGIEDLAEMQAAHIRKATWLNETAVSYAEEHGLGHSRFHAEMLFSLTQKYYLEARAIMEGGSNSYRIRQSHPDIHAVQDKFDALDLRHTAGLATLLKLRDTFAEVAGFGPEAAAMAELYIADWNALFNKSADITAGYQRAITALHEAGVPEARIARFLSGPATIPSSRLDLRVSDAMALGSENSRFGRSANSAHTLSLIEPASHLAGFTQELALVDWQGGLEQDWSRVTVSMTIDPTEQIRVRNGAFRTKSKVTGSDVEVQDSEADRKVTNKAVERIKTLSFRPAFVDGQAVASTLILDYHVRDSVQRSVTPLITGNWVSALDNGFPNFQVRGRGASPAATGE